MPYFWYPGDREAVRHRPGFQPRDDAEQTALARIRRASCAGLDVADFLNEVNPIVNQVVRNGTATIDSPFWYTLDPESHLVTSIYGQGYDMEPGDQMRWDLLADDFIKTPTS